MRCLPSNKLAPLVAQHRRHFFHLTHSLNGPCLPQGQGKQAILFFWTLHADPTTEVALTSRCRTEAAELVARPEELEEDPSRVIEEAMKDKRAWRGGRQRDLTLLVNLTTPAMESDKQTRVGMLTQASPTVSLLSKCKALKMKVQPRTKVQTRHCKKRKVGLAWASGTGGRDWAGG